MVFFEIDNPGKGNCAFYGFAIGLIDIIKHEYAIAGTSSTYDALASRIDNFAVNLDEVLSFNFKHQSKLILDRMQTSLRVILLNHRKQELVDNKESLSTSMTFNHFGEIVRNYLDNRSTRSTFNELAKSAPLKYSALNVARQIQRVMKRYQQKPSNLNYRQKWEAYIDKVIAKAFIDDVYTSGAEVGLRNDSLVIAAMADVTVNFRWGTQTDLNDLARIFNVNLHTLRNGTADYHPTDTPLRPIITMNNKRNRHWTTQLSFVGTGFTGKEYSVASKDSVLSKQEIIAIMQTYTNGFISRVTSRNHRGKAQDIITQCYDAELTVTDIVTALEAYLKDSDFTVNSSFQKRTRYILARAAFHNLTPAALSSAAPQIK